MPNKPVNPIRIAHVDLDAFYASCEQQDNPQYRGKPVIVGALPGKRGVVAAASYEARKFGIHSAMPISEAYRRCPWAVYLRPDMAKYRRRSRQVFKILETISPVVEAASIDEAYLDLKGLEKLLGRPETIGSLIKQDIESATGLKASIGMGPNRLIAKLGSDHGKPDGLSIVYPEQVLEFLGPMPINNLRGVGEKTRQLFAKLNIQTIGQLREADLNTLVRVLGRRAATSFYQQALGVGATQVVPRRRRKSISKEHTFPEDIRRLRELHHELHKLAIEVARTARQECLSGQVIFIKIRHENFDTHTRQVRLNQATNDERQIFKQACALLSNSGLATKPVRLIGVGLRNWQQDDDAQADLFGEADTHTRRSEILNAIDSVTEKFGAGSIALGLSGTTQK